jgi:NAD(P)H-dependent flavin oxidoreductase YrpB (nitropropane dioxygenase family)
MAFNDSHGADSLPSIIQGGMGVGVSGWRLARAVSQRGFLGVAAGTALSLVLVRRLQQGDPEGDIRRAAAHFPIQAVVERTLENFFVPGGIPSEQPYRLTPLPTQNSQESVVELTVLANFIEVFLAKEGHDGLVGINYLEKIQIPTLPSLYGAMLAGVDCVLMGAGIPWAIPGFLDAFAEGRAAELKLDVEGALPGEVTNCEFDPQKFFSGNAPQLKRPKFLAIISSATLAIALSRKSTGRLDGFIVEGPTAGGHNAPPRGQLQLNEKGEPVYGVRDVPDLVKIGALGLPFWLAGSYGTPEKLAQAKQLGAAGVQVGTPFAFCNESGILPELKRQVIERALTTGIHTYTDPVASPTGFPFKVVELENTLADEVGYQARERICDLGYLRHLYRRDDGSIGYRCPSEPVADYIAKQGATAETVGRKCVCNGLMATMGLGQMMASNERELPLITSGDDVALLARMLKPGCYSYSANDVIDYLTGKSH